MADRILTAFDWRESLALERAAGGVAPRISKRSPAEVAQLREQMIALRRDGWRLAEIAARLRVSKRYVQELTAGQLSGPQGRSRASEGTQARPSY